MTHDQFARELHLERAQLVQLLSEARGLLSRASVYVDHFITTNRQKRVQDVNLDIVLRTQKDIQQFIDAGLFGDSKGEVK
jgi:hypothetical protein